MLHLACVDRSLVCPPVREVAVCADALEVLNTCLLVRDRRGLSSCLVVLRLLSGLSFIGVVVLYIPTRIVDSRFI